MIRKNLFRYSLIIVLLAVFILPVQHTLAAAPTPQPTVQPTVQPPPQPPFALTILHTDDVHAHDMPDSSGNGGAARQAAVVKQVRAEPKINVLLLDAGDRFTGTLFHVAYKGMDAAQIMNPMKYDAMTLGNHEFDNNSAVLAAFIKALRFPVVNTNIDFSKSKELNGLVKPYVIVKVGGQSIGITGAISPETPTLAKPAPELVFDIDLAAAVQKAVDEMTAQGVNKIILLSHIGYQADIELASKLKGVDIIVGGHSHTLQSNIYKAAVDAYPKAVKSASDEPLVIVHASSNLTYMGRLDVQFDEKGILTKNSGDVILLSRYIAPEAGTQAIVARLNSPLDKLRAQALGESAVDLDGSRESCRFKECNLGNLITDAMRVNTKAQVAIMNGGSIRTSIAKGKVTMGQVLEVLPFGNLISTFKLKGSDVLAALENGVSRVDAEEGTGRFSQVSGLKYTFDASKEVGQRIAAVEVYNAEKQAYEALDPAAEYTVAAPDFIRSGGDGYEVLAKQAIDPYDYGDLLDQVLAAYVTDHSPISINVEGRITNLAEK